MTDLLMPTGYYAFADYCPHDVVSEDEDPGDGIHVGDEEEGLLICLLTPIQPPGVSQSVPVVCESVGPHTHIYPLRVLSKFDIRLGFTLPFATGPCRVCTTEPKAKD